MNAADMMLITNMLNNIISELDDVKQMVKDVTLNNYEIPADEE